jgi:hypothetical protein
MTLAKAAFVALSGWVITLSRRFLPRGVVVRSAGYFPSNQGNHDNQRNHGKQGSLKISPTSFPRADTRLSLHVKCPLLLSFLTKTGICRQILENSPISDFLKICSFVLENFHVYGQTDSDFQVGFERS